MRIPPLCLTFLAAVCGTAVVAVAPAAQADSNGRDCRDAAATSLCHKPSRAPTSAGGPDPALQQAIGGNMANPSPPIAAIG